MAYHYIEPDYTKLEIGALYADDLYKYASKSKLRKVNNTTGICLLMEIYSGTTYYISVTQLSNWYKINE